ncbi:rodlin [Streptomyces platensis]|uniref:rodlin n=1 Tax=Streptomyces platensis TaxID=58346 RepID=UPI002E0EA2DC|nr:rodlin [Streptomyces platensis]WTI53761.1 rodlin [Streptomyces platensis]WUB80647.1 rodlin [Streptomyces platensis]
MKKMMAGAAVAASLVGMTAAAAPQAMAIGDDHGTSTVNGNGSKSIYGNSTTRGNLSTQLGLVQGSLNDLCLGLPKINLAAVAQDINVLSSPQNQQCVENSSQAKGDEALSHIVDDIAVLSGNGVANR